MTTTRGEWIRFLLAGLSIAAAPFGLSTARAQGFGPDPFRPYNSQYEPYVRPLSDPGLAAGAAASARGGRGDNQFQDYLNQLDGADRAVFPTLWNRRPVLAGANRRRARPARIQGKSAYRPIPRGYARIDQPEVSRVFFRERPEKARRAATGLQLNPPIRRGEPLRREAGADDRDTAADPDSERRPRSRAGSDDAALDPHDERPIGRRGAIRRVVVLPTLNRRECRVGFANDPTTPPLRRGSRGSTIRKGAHQATLSIAAWVAGTPILGRRRHCDVEARSGPRRLPPTSKPALRRNGRSKSLAR